MAKKADKDPLEKARRKLAQAQLKLHVAEDKHMQARARGKQEVEQARLRASEWLTAAAERVERRREQVARAEERLLALINEDETQKERIVTPDEAALEDASELAILEDETPLDVVGANGGAGPTLVLRDREMRALLALYERFRDEGATVGQWRAVAGMPETTFARARRTLLEGGLIAQDGDGGRHTRYTLTDLGVSASQVY